jgi:hypothetical protein
VDTAKCTNVEHVKRLLPVCQMPGLNRSALLPVRVQRKLINFVKVEVDGVQELLALLASSNEEEVLRRLLCRKNSLLLKRALKGMLAFLATLQVSTLIAPKVT